MTIRTVTGLALLAASLSLLLPNYAFAQVSGSSATVSALVPTPTIENWAYGITAAPNNDLSGSDYGFNDDGSYSSSCGCNKSITDASFSASVWAILENNTMTSGTVTCYASKEIVGYEDYGINGACGSSATLFGDTLSNYQDGVTGPHYGSYSTSEPFSVSITLAAGAALTPSYSGSVSGWADAPAP